MGDRERRFPKTGPVEENPWPDKLAARVLSPGHPRRLHGFDVEGDLARHYSFGEVALTALTGTAPDERAGRACEICMIFLSPAPVWEAPAHAALVSRLAGAYASGVMATGAIALAEQARFTLESQSEVLQWLDEPRGDPPHGFIAADDVESARVERLRVALGEVGYAEAIPDGDPGILAAIFAVLKRCGLTQAHQLEALMVTSRLPCLIAEAFEARPGQLEAYALDLPHYDYVGPGDDE